LTVAEAVAEASAYKTFVMSGNALAVDEMRAADGTDNTVATAPRRQVGQANAAKLEPWNPTTDAPPAWMPNETLVRTFKAVFPEPLVLDRLAKAAPTTTPTTAPWLGAVGAGTTSPSKTSTPLNLAQYRVGAPVESIFYIPNYVSETEEAACLRQLADTPAELKKPLDRRVVQEYGGVMCPTCNMSFVTDVNQPPWTSTICDALTRDRVFSPSVCPNNTRVHEYEPGHGIAPHCDGPIYVPRVAILSLANPVLMSFYARRPVYDDVMEHYNDTFRFEGAIAKERPIFSLVLEPRSLLVFERDAYWHHPHGISAKTEDSLLEADAGPIANRHLLTTISPAQLTLPRKYRVGVTVRNLLPRCQHHEDRAEYCMAHAQRIHLGETVEGIFADPSSGCDRVPAPAAPVTSMNIAAAKSTPAATPAVAATPASAPAPAAHIRSAAVAAADPELLAAMRSVQHSLDAVLRQQQDLAKQVQEMQVVLALQTQASHKFTSETATVLDHMSSVVLDLQASVEDIRLSTESSRN
jgi:alkylated DNA repair protein alkB family protein 6